MDTIVVTGKYVVSPSQSLDFQNEPAFSLQSEGPGFPAVVNKGAVTITGSDVTGLTADGDGSFWNQAGATFDLRVTDSGGVAIQMASGTADFRNDGDITMEADQGGDGGSARLLDGLNMTFVNTGLMSGTDAEEQSGIQFFGGSQVDNSGDVDVAGTFAATAFEFRGDNNDFNNSGVIRAQSTTGFAAGVLVGQGADDFTFHNSGSIYASSNPAADGIGVLIEEVAAGFVPVFHNSGLIEAHSAFREQTSGTGVPVTVDNTGRIIGDIDLGGGGDTVINSGKITGDIDLGKDDDSYDGSHGKLSGTVIGDRGDDVLVGGKQGDMLFGDTATASDQDGNDTLTGGKGADTLTGGHGDDVFDYLKPGDSTVDHSDLITDLEAGDRIDLSKIDADTTQAGNQAFVLVTALDGHAAEAALTYDPGADVTRLELDTNGDGAADALILISGDHHDFTNFAL
jgi:hypothetical protein